MAGVSCRFDRQSQIREDWRRNAAYLESRGEGILKNAMGRIMLVLSPHRAGLLNFDDIMILSSVAAPGYIGPLGPIGGRTEAWGSPVDEPVPVAMAPLNPGVAKDTSKSSVFDFNTITWTATNPNGTGATYQVIRRTDINWNRVRFGGDQRGRGLTNAEAAKRFGLRPELDDGNFATLHHVGQDARGPLVEASTRYHGLFRPGHESIHGIYGRNRPHPEFPVDRRAWQDFDVPDYWTWREQNR